MTPIKLTSPSPDDQKILTAIHEEYHKYASSMSYSTAAASFLFIGALIVIACSCLCLTLPGVNVIDQIILPAIVPSIIAIILAIPFIINSVKKAQRAKKLRKEGMMPAMIALLEGCNVHRNFSVVKSSKKDEKENVIRKKQRINFILEHLLKWPTNPTNAKKLDRNLEWPKEYQQKMLTELKKKIEGDKKAKDLSKYQKRITKAIDDTLPKIHKK